MQKLIPIFFFIFTTFAFATIDKNKVFVVVNTNNKDSEKTAQYYCSVREIPLDNIIRLKIDDTDILSRPKYQTTVEKPLIDELVKRKKINVSELATDSHTQRTSYAFLSHDVDCIVLSFLPWKILNDKTKWNAFNSDAASVDSEISAVFLPSKSLNGPIKNPLYKNFSPNGIHKVYGVLPVARLDGTDFETAKQCIDSSLSAERKGLRGRVYIDKCKKAKLGDKWLDDAAKILTDMGYDTTIDELPPMMNSNMRFDYPAFYFGWYSNIPYYYLADEDFRMPDGAIALHIYSFSAAYIRKIGWVYHFLKKNCAQTYGNTSEPFLAATHDIGALMSAYVAGLSAGEASYASIPVLSWQNLSVGDPLYKPFSYSLEMQLKDIDDGKFDELSQYVILRKMNLLIRDGKTDEAILLAEKYVDKIEDAALVWRLLDEYKKKENIDAVRALTAKLNNRDLCTNQNYRGLAMEFAAFMRENGNSTKSLEIYKKLLGTNPSDLFERNLNVAAIKAHSKLGIKPAKEFRDLSERIAERDRKAKAEKEEKSKKEKK